MKNQTQADAMDWEALQQLCHSEGVICCYFLSLYSIKLVEAILKEIMFANNGFEFKVYYAF